MSLPKEESFRLLVIDDESMIRANLKEYLTNYHQADYQILVDEASYAEEALEKINQNHYDLIICDINLPDKDGFFVLREAHKAQPGRKTALITAYDMDSYIRTAREEKIYNIITKIAPFNFTELSTVVNNLLKPLCAFGLQNYLESPGPYAEVKIRSSHDIITAQEVLLGYLKQFDLPDIDAQSVAIIEAITNAVYHALKNPDGSLKYRKGEVIDCLGDDEIVTVTYASDYEKVGISILDQGGSISADEILYWIDRNISGESLLDTHGRGVYLIHRLMDRMVINVERGKRTELIMINYVVDPPPENKPLYINEF